MNQRFFAELVFCGLLLISAASAALAAIQSHEPLVSSVTSHSARIWARSDSPATIRVEYATDPSLGTAAATASIETTSASDFTAIFDLDSLAPETRYHYRVMIDGVAAQVYPYPSLVTFPPEGSSADFAIGVLADLQNMRTFPEVSAPAYAALAADAPTVVLQIGDFDHRNPQTLTAMRNMRKSTRGAESASGEDWAREIAPRFPVYYVYDDHDYGTNNGDKTWIGRADALQVYGEYFPTTRPNPSAGTWHKIVYGDVEIFMLDVRSQRDPNDSTDDSSKSMLDGDNIANGQKGWLLNGLLNSTARWKVLVSGVPFKSDSKLDDGWPAFMTERQELLDWITDYGIENVFVISGDLHTGGAIDDGTYADLPELSVPHTNLPTINAASGPHGQWSHGMTPGFEGGGYALLTFFSAAGEVLLEVKDEVGNVRHSMILQSIGGSISGELTVNHEWKELCTDGSAQDAVVLLGPPTYNGEHPGVMRMRATENADCPYQVRLQEWDYRGRDLNDWWHTNEQVSYLHLSPDVYEMDEGSIWEVGSFQHSGTGNWKWVGFQRNYAEPPLVFLTMQSTNGEQAATVRAKEVGRYGFQAAIFEEEYLMDGHLQEDIGYVAIYHPDASSSDRVDGHATFNGMDYAYTLHRILVDHEWAAADGVALKLEEEQSLDQEVGHMEEAIDVLQIADQVFAQQVSSWGNDTTALRRR